VFKMKRVEPNQYVQRIYENKKKFNINIENKKQKKLKIVRNDSNLSQIAARIKGKIKMAIKRSKRPLMPPLLMISLI
jgi:translation initiation factor IF-1